jgi:hypothetical protein
MLVFSNNEFFVSNLGVILLDLIKCGKTNF